MENEIREVPCPYCGGVLYRLGTLAPDVHGVARGSAELEHDEAGPFMRCLACGARVALDATPIPGSGVKLTVAPGQGGRGR